MKRNVLRLFLVLALCAPLLAPQLARASFDEGIDYKKIDPPQPTSAPTGKIEVDEMFWYGCPHCFHFEPKLLEWLKHKPKDVVFVRIPAVFPGPEHWAFGAKIFYTEKALGVLSKTHEAVFNAIHIDHQPMSTEAEVQKFFARHGVPAKEFNDAFHSFGVYTEVRRAADLSRRYQITGVPTLVVDGKYRVDADLAGGQERMLKIVDFLIKKERAARQKASKH